MQFLRTLIAAAAAALAMTGLALAGAGPHIKVFDGVNSISAARGGEIEILSWSWGETNEAPREGPGSIQIKAPSGKHSEMFARWHREQKVLPAVQFVAPDGKSGKYYTITFSDVLISSYQTGGSAGGDVVPVDTISLNFGAIKFEY